MKVSVDLYHRISYTHVYLVHFIIRIARWEFWKHWCDILKPVWNGVCE
jgi:hypothetical protein